MSQTRSCSTGADSTSPRSVVDRRGSILIQACKPICKTPDGNRTPREDMKRDLAGAESLLMPRRTRHEKTDGTASDALLTRWLSLTALGYPTAPRSPYAGLSSLSIACRTSFISRTRIMRRPALRITAGGSRTNRASDRAFLSGTSTCSGHRSSGRPARSSATVQARSRARSMLTLTMARPALGSTRPRSPIQGDSSPIVPVFRLPGEPTHG